VASDGDRKDKTGKPEDPFQREGDDSWMDAVEEWGTGLELPDDPPFGTTTSGSEATPTLMPGETGSYVLTSTGEVKLNDLFEDEIPGEPVPEPAPALDEVDTVEVALDDVLDEEHLDVSEELILESTPVIDIPDFEDALTA